MILITGIFLIIDGIFSKDKRLDRTIRAVLGLLLICASLILQIRHNIAWAAEEQILTGQCSWYSKNDPTDPFKHKFNADGSRFNEDVFTCAMQSRNFGKQYRITNIKNGKSVIARHRDFGPARRYKGRALNRIIDLSKAAFAKIANLDEGVIQVRIESL